MRSTTDVATGSLATRFTTYQAGVNLLGIATPKSATLYGMTKSPDHPMIIARAERLEGSRGSELYTGVWLVPAGPQTLSPGSLPTPVAWPVLLKTQHPCTVRNLTAAFVANNVLVFA